MDSIMAKEKEFLLVSSGGREDPSAQFQEKNHVRILS
jgi:hypothetical protein